MSEQNIDILGLAATSIHNFEAGSVEEIPSDYPNEQPVRFEPYLVPDGVFYAMEKAGIDPLEHPETMATLIEIARISIKHCQRREKGRRQFADYLNKKLYLAVDPQG